MSGWTAPDGRVWSCRALYELAKLHGQDGPRDEPETGAEPIQLTMF